MRNETPDKIAIQEGEWIIVIPTKTATVQDLADIVLKLRNPDNRNIALKPGWRLDHV